MKIVLWGAFLALLLLLWGREILAFGQARREKENPRRDELRFRRRTLGLFVLLLLGAFYEIGGRLTFAGPEFELSYWGVCLILLIWLLIIATRDFRDLADLYVEKREEVTLQALVDMERELQKEARKRNMQASSPGIEEDNRPIPPPGPSGNPQDGGDKGEEKPRSR